MNSVQAAQSWGSLSAAHCKGAEGQASGQSAADRIIAKSEVAQHTSRETGIWVTHKVV